VSQDFITNARKHTDIDIHGMAMKYLG